jgi:hypothetical protein
MKINPLLYLVSIFVTNIWSSSLDAKEPFPETVDPFPTALTIQVLGEDGSSPGPVNLRLGFYNSSHPKLKNSGQVYWYDDRQTDNDGRLQVVEATRGFIHVVAEKNGYYPSMKEHNQILTEKRLIPWNPTMKVVLKKIGDPVPMLVNADFRKRIPEIGKEYAMDLLEGDWLAPHGKGKIEDCFFSVVGDQKSSKLVIRFPNPGDGMIRVERYPGGESRLGFPREAPAQGYVPLVEITEVYGPNSESLSFADAMSTGYIFRIRTPKDAHIAEGGPIYGKIVSAFVFFGIQQNGEDLISAFGSSFLYSNPVPGDRRIEADLTSNLRKGVSPPLFP